MHTPVLEQELVAYLDTRPGDNFIDCTLGEGGHARAILKKTITGKLLGIERDKDLYLRAKSRLAVYNKDKRVIIVNDSYINLEKIRRQKAPAVTFKGIYFDLGACLWHFRNAKRGFSFKKYNEELDMRFNPEEGVKAADILNLWSEQRIKDCLRKYGQLENPDKLARAIVDKRKKLRFEKTEDLIELIKIKTKKFSFRQRQQLIRKTFQALRIAVNHELDNIKEGLTQAVDSLMPGGRIVVISYHSLEDKLVKNFFKIHPQLEPINKKPTKPTILEIRFNPGARSAKLRAAIKIKANL